MSKLKAGDKARDKETGEYVGIARDSGSDYYFMVEKWVKRKVLYPQY